MILPGFPIGVLGFTRIYQDSTRSIKNYYAITWIAQAFYEDSLTGLVGFCNFITSVTLVTSVTLPSRSNPNQNLIQSNQNPGRTQDFLRSPLVIQSNSLTIDPGQNPSNSLVILGSSQFPRTSFVVPKTSFVVLGAKWMLGWLASPGLVSSVHRVPPAPCSGGLERAEPEAERG